MAQRCESINSGTSNCYSNSTWSVSIMGAEQARSIRCDCEPSRKKSGESSAGSKPSTGSKRICQSGLRICEFRPLDRSNHITTSKEADPTIAMRPVFARLNRRITPATAEAAEGEEASQTQRKQPNSHAVEGA